MTLHNDRPAPLPGTLLLVDDLPYAAVHSRSYLSSTASSAAIVEAFEEEIQELRALPGGVKEIAIAPSTELPVDPGLLAAAGRQGQTISPDYTPSTPDPIVSDTTTCTGEHCPETTTPACVGEHCSGTTTPACVGEHCSETTTPACVGEHCSGSGDLTGCIGDSCSGTNTDTYTGANKPPCQ